MPNIELHGYGDKPVDFRNKIRAALKESPNAGEIVTTVCRTAVTDLNDKPMPFLRVISSLDGLEDLLKRLKPLGEDIEVIALHKWIPGIGEGNPDHIFVSGSDGENEALSTR